MNAGLYLVGTPIGNLEDITLRALSVLRSCDRLYAEDTRHTRKLLTHFDLSRPALSCHKFNEAARVQEVLSAIRGGESVALVSSAGMPGISDPGSRLVRACRAEALPVTAVPGPTAVTTLVPLSARGDGGFVFEGFPPPKAGARRRNLTEAAERTRPTVYYESPHRVQRFLGEIAEVMPDRDVTVGRELTKQHEEIATGPAADLASRLQEVRPRGEYVILIAGLTRAEQRRRAREQKTNP